jgi:type VI protein secretion system component VasF
MTFDTLSYARRLRQAGVPEPQAEAMADATRELVVQEFATKADLAGIEQRIKSDLAALEQRLTAAMETLSLRLTVRMGVMLAAGLSLVVALIGVLIRSH